MDELDNYTEDEKQKAFQSMLRRHEHKPTTALLHRRNYQEHRDRYLRAAQQRYQDHKPEIAEYIQQYRRKHKQEEVERHQKYYSNNRDKILKHNRELRIAHPEVRRRERANRRARLANAEGNYTLEELRLKFTEFDNKCAYCGASDNLTPDHAVPLSRGGSNYIDNIVPACSTCNEEKNAMTAEEFFASIDAGHEERVAVRRWMSQNPELANWIEENKEGISEVHNPMRRQKR